MWPFKSKPKKPHTWGKWSKPVRTRYMAYRYDPDPICGEVSHDIEAWEVVEDTQTRECTVCGKVKHKTKRIS